jgi:glycosyl transferase family 2
MIDPAAPDFTDTPAAEGRPRFGYAAAQTGAEPAVTIVTPFFNTEPRILEETAVAVRRQSLQQWEWLIVDDGSTRQDARDSLLRISRSDSRIRVVRHEENRGLPAARNTGVARATAPYVLFLDDDDLLEPTALEKWLWFLESHPEYALVNGFSIGFGTDEYLWKRGFHDGNACLVDNYVDGTCLVRRHVHVEVGGRAGRLGFLAALCCCGPLGRHDPGVPQVVPKKARPRRPLDERERHASGGNPSVLAAALPAPLEGGFPSGQGNASTSR